MVLQCLICHFHLGVARSALCLLKHFGSISAGFATFATSFSLHVIRLSMFKTSESTATVKYGEMTDLFFNCLNVQSLLRGEENSTFF